MGRKTSLTGKVKLFLWAFVFPFWLSSRFFFLSGPSVARLLWLLSAGLGGFWASGLVGFAVSGSCFPLCFSVTSEADPRIRLPGAPTQEPASFGQVHPAVTKPDGSLTVATFGQHYVHHRCSGTLVHSTRRRRGAYLAGCCGSGTRCRWKRCGVLVACCCGSGKSSSIVAKNDAGLQHSLFFLQLCQACVVKLHVMPATYQQFSSQVLEHIFLCASWHALDVDTAARERSHLLGESQVPMCFAATLVSLPLEIKSYCRHRHASVARK